MRLRPDATLGIVSTNASTADELTSDERAVVEALRSHAEVTYAMVFGSRARGTARIDSDLDVAIGLQPGTARDARALGTLIADLEAATRRQVDLTLLDEAPPALAFRVFREGRTILVRDHAQLVARRARAILDYLDFRPYIEQCTRGVLEAAARGR